MKRYLPLLVLAALLMSTLACAYSTIFSSETNTSSPTAAVTAEIIKPNPIPTYALPTTTSGLRDTESLLVSLYEQVSPGVVSIQTIDAQGGVQGSGFVYDKDGHIITNYHVVENAEKLEVDFPSGIKVYGDVVGVDLDSDIAVIKVDVAPESLFPVIMGDSDQLKVGQTVVAIGNPYGLTGTMTTGIISAKGRILTSLRETPEGRLFSAGDLIQTDASINPGNSGGPLLNLNGEVVGINRAIQTNGITTSGEPVNTGIGFAVSVNIVKKVAPVLIAQGKYDYPYLGLSAREELTLIEREAVNVDYPTGAYVVEVVPDSPADRAGILAGTVTTDFLGLNAGGDLIIGVDGRQVLTFGDLLSYIMTQKNPGDTITLKIIRNQQEMEVPITLDKRP
jgi:S1-C subfamily serine protease